MSSQYQLNNILKQAPRSAKLTNDDVETFSAGNPTETASEKEQAKKPRRIKSRARSLKPKRMPVWVYLKESERLKLEDAAIEAEASISEYIRGVLKKAAGI
jgi:hypothetical protein